ncbi:MAG: PD40 domain-containing protein [Phycisphaerales bacterium]|nr:PD40 domain-containing protein [Phycisphaerales bacterium]
MKTRILIGAAIGFSITLLAPRAKAESHLMRFADVHGDTIVFTYEDDLWLVPTTGGEARRITRDPGSETYAKFSPDGSQIAFTAQYDGGTDVYVMDAHGGEPQRLTYHPSRDRVLGWHPDGERILFRSTRTWPRRGEEIYLVSVDGGMPERVNVDRAGLAAISPDGKQLAYNRISREDRTWKRHQGGTAQDIWMGSLADGDYHKITDWPGTDNYPMWAGDAIYFTSDRAHGTLNIYRYDTKTGETAALTDYRDYDVKYPSLGDGRIVYQYAESPYLLDIATGESKKVEIDIPSDRVRMRQELVDVSPRSGSFGLSPAGKRVVLEARGEILNVPAEDGEPINLTRTTGSREKDATWSPDGKWVAFISDKTGEEELYLVDQHGTGEWRQLTTDGKGYRKQPVWSPDSKYLVFSDKAMRLNLVDVNAASLKVIDQGEYDDGWYRWGIQDYEFSPDSKWITYSKMERSFNESIFLHNIADGRNHRVTSEMTEDFSPSFDPDGKYLYFLSYRTFSPVMGFVDQNHVFLDMCKPYVVLLQNDEPSPFAPKDSSAEVKDDDDGDNDDSDKKDEKKEDKDKAKETRIDLDGIERRIVEADGVPSGNYWRLTGIDGGFVYLKRGGLEFLKYQTVDDETTEKLDLYKYDIEERETKEVLPGIANYHISADGKKLVYRSGSKYGVVDTGKEAKVGDGAIDLDGVHIMVDRQQEFMQIFNEAWRVQRDWFYDANMHGLDWAANGEKYRRFVPFCGNRGDLNYLIGEMIGELNIGHTYVNGGDFADDERHVPVGLLGADFAANRGDAFYHISHIYPSTPGDPTERSPFDEPGCPIHEGDYLLAIDGVDITADGASGGTGISNVYAALVDKAGKVVTITYNDKPTRDGAKTYRTKTLRNEWGVRYREWVEHNRTMVEKATDGKIGYVHIPDMMENGAIEFAKVFFPHYYKQAFIVDERYNGGGFVSDMLIDRLERKVWSVTIPREGKQQPNPERAFNGPFVVLINEDTGSSGEWFAEAIKRRGLAPLIGMRTWGGVVGIEAHQPLVDGGVTTPPQFGPYGLNGDWPVEGHGVDPDIEVQNMPHDVLQGKDAQLEAAIKLMQEKIAEHSYELPPPPPYPTKTKPE